MSTMMTEETGTARLSVAQTMARLLTFRLTREEFLEFDHRHLVFGLCCTWVVGVGRWWDDARQSLTTSGLRVARLHIYTGSDPVAGDISAQIEKLVL